MHCFAALLQSHEAKVGAERQKENDYDDDTKGGAVLGRLWREQSIFAKRSVIGHIPIIARTAAGVPRIVRVENLNDPDGRGPDLASGLLLFELGLVFFFVALLALFDYRHRLCGVEKSEHFAGTGLF